jgi:hypothetical protein
MHVTVTTGIIEGAVTTLLAKAKLIFPLLPA